MFKVFGKPSLVGGENKGKKGYNTAFEYLRAVSPQRTQPRNATDPFVECLGGLFQNVVSPFLRVNKKVICRLICVLKDFRLVLRFSKSFPCHTTCTNSQKP